MNYQKYITAILYALEVPLSVWAGFELGVRSYLFGAVLVIVMMCVEIAAVVTWMNAQTIELDQDLLKAKKSRRKRR